MRPRDVSSTEFQVLQVLCAGRTVGEGVSLAEEICRPNVEELAAQLRGWFQRWSADGFFQALEPKNTT